MHQSRPSTSRNTQRLFIRLNTLHYLLAHLHALDKSLSFSCNGGPHHSGLYVQSVAEARIHSGGLHPEAELDISGVLTDRAQPLAVKEVMKASFEAFLMVLLAGGNDQAFTFDDYDSVVEDFQSLKRVLCSSWEGLVAEEVVEREAEVAKGIVALMALPTSSTSAAATKVSLAHLCRSQQQHIPGDSTSSYASVAAATATTGSVGLQLRSSFSLEHAQLQVAGKNSGRKNRRR
ncbi:hypothetical protein Cni_G15806 [Canna indica]|uniref:MHD2 domain-containing protein n=1 Tax=Canna indica TaxID=4628 RepID=A0AAQ3KGR6_9LILI|nr:hypothetical protein Cni_G15806 [Canna indica]